MLMVLVLRWVVPFMQGTCSWSLERGGGGHSDVKAPTGQLYLWSSLVWSYTSHLPSARHLRACPDGSVKSFAELSWLAWDTEDGRSSTQYRLASPFLTASLFEALEPPREARHETVVRPNYGGYCCVLCVLPHSDETWSDKDTGMFGIASLSPDYDHPITCETSQQRRGAHRVEETGRSMGGDRKNRVLGVGRGSGSWGRYSFSPWGTIRAKYLSNSSFWKAR
ncbi:hypothetical protein Taro_055267 [Colocasia esculenta]|uniref:Secreted protein n=1 Tax=Colocasia esculenta TaxID=4460 RepID=A0A843XQK0_COLES|nr:hypothetical protein [Colocasia esculenta]